MFEFSCWEWLAMGAITLTVTAARAWFEVPYGVLAVSGLLFTVIGLVKGVRQGERLW